MLRFLYRSITLLCTLILLTLLGLALTPLPKKAQHWLKTSVPSSKNPPKTIILLGGGGIPSKSGLLRCYTAAERHHKTPTANIIIALPSDTDPKKTSTGRMRDELILRGVPAQKITLEHKARSTAQQAQAIATLIGQKNIIQNILIVTDPSHMRRSMLSFKKAGFVNIQSAPSRNLAQDANPGPNALLRYGFWNNLHLEITCLRELIALQWYKHKKYI